MLSPQAPQNVQTLETWLLLKPEDKQVQRLMLPAPLGQKSTQEKKKKINTGIGLNRISIYWRVVILGDTGELALKGRAPRVSRNHRLYREITVMETKGVGVMGAPDWTIRRE